MQQTSHIISRIFYLVSFYASILIWSKFMCSSVLARYGSSLWLLFFLLHISITSLDYSSLALGHLHMITLALSNLLPRDRQVLHRNYIYPARALSALGLLLSDSAPQMHWRNPGSYSKKRTFGPKSENFGPKKTHFLILTMFRPRPGNVVQRKKYRFTK